MPASAPESTPHRRRPVCLTAGRLELQFQWRIDRWAHRLLCDGRSCWQSIEAVPAQDASMPLGVSPDWPASPAFTEVSLVETATGPALLAVGRAGRSHFSASLAAVQAEPDTIVAELACRVQEQPAWLGSAYQPLLDAGETGPSADWLAIRPAPVTDLQHPATITWAYYLTVAGIRAVPPASCEPHPFRAD